MQCASWWQKYVTLDADNRASAKLNIQYYCSHPIVHRAMAVTPTGSRSDSEFLLSYLLYTPTAVPTTNLLTFSHAGDSSSAPSEPSEQSNGRQMPPRGSLVTPNSFPGSSRYCASCLLSVKWSVTMKTVDFLPGEGSLSTRARMRFKIVKP